MSAQSPDEIRRWRVPLRHDRGTTRIVLTATSAERARAIIRDIERCPDRSITRLEDLGPVLADAP